MIYASVLVESVRMGTVPGGLNFAMQELNVGILLVQCRPEFPVMQVCVSPKLEIAERGQLDRQPLEDTGEGSTQ
jgi:hypothetical protein